MSVESVDECLDGWLVEVADVGSRLAWLLAGHEGLWVDETESVDDDLSLYGLNRINDNGDGPWVELLERLLGVDIDRREPASKTWMRVVPSNDGFWAKGELDAYLRP